MWWEMVGILFGGNVVSDILWSAKRDKVTRRETSRAESNRAESSCETKAKGVRDRASEQPFAYHICFIRICKLHAQFYVAVALR